MGNTKQLGDWGENIAVGYLKNKKYEILDRNFRVKWLSRPGGGEIDIIAKQKKKIVFVEVKTIRKFPEFLPQDKINQKKKKQLAKMAQVYLNKNNLALNTPHQIDIIGITIDGQDIKINHFENAVKDTY